MLRNDFRDAFCTPEEKFGIARSLTENLTTKLQVWNRDKFELALMNDSQFAEELAVFLHKMDNK